MTKMRTLAGEEQPQGSTLCPSMAYDAENSRVRRRILRGWPPRKSSQAMKQGFPGPWNPHQGRKLRRVRPPRHWTLQIKVLKEPETTEKKARGEKQVGRQEISQMTPRTMYGVQTEGGYDRVEGGLVMRGVRVPRQISVLYWYIIVYFAKKCIL